jgi:hypothetical protein
MTAENCILTNKITSQEALLLNRLLSDALLCPGPLNLSGLRCCVLVGYGSEVAYIRAGSREAYDHRISYSKACSIKHSTTSFNPLQTAYATRHSMLTTATCQAHKPPSGQQTSLLRMCQGHGTDVLYMLLGVTSCLIYMEENSYRPGA